MNKITKKGKNFYISYTVIIPYWETEALLKKLKILEASKLPKGIKKEIKKIWVDKYLDKIGKYFYKIPTDIRKQLVQGVSENNVKQFKRDAIMNPEIYEIEIDGLIDLILSDEKETRQQAIKEAKKLSLSVRVALVRNVQRFQRWHGKKWCKYVCKELGIKLNEWEYDAYNI